MSEPMWKREDGTQSMPSWGTYAEAMNEFTKSAKAFMEHVYLLTEARTAYQKATSVGTELRNRLDAGDRTLHGLMTQLKQVVSAHMGETPLEGRKPELVKNENARTGSQAADAWKAFP